MLKKIRQSLKYTLKITLWIVILSFVVTIFYSWGVRSTSSGGVGRGVVAKVAGEPISLDQYQRALKQQYEFYRRMLGEKFNDKVAEQLKAQILEGLILNRLVLQEARRFGLSVSPEELRAEIKAYPAFLEKGQFSRERYLQALAADRLTPERFEEDLRQDLLLRKVEDLIKSSVKVSPLEAKEAYWIARSKVRVEYVTIAPPKDPKEVSKKLLEAAQQGRPLRAAAQAAGLEVVSLGPFSREDPLRPIPDEATFKNAAFSLREGEVSPLIQGENQVYLIRLLDRQEPDPAQFAKERESFRQGYLLEKRERLFGEWLKALRAKAKVQVDRGSF
ncbi:MAG: SurA N-terminal domain-containing protein [candidate division NC10 bacterium]|nr:SurA N-terminal domain-containing protein [candidate division NC10 bacterium]